MLKYLFLFMLLLGAIPLKAQSVEELTKAGIEAHDAGKYDEAVKLYHQALKQDPYNPLLHFELAYSYNAKKEYDKAILYADKILEAENDYALPAYLVKGSALDNAGRVRESIKLFKKAIRKFPGEYLLHYNLGLDYYRIKDFKKAKKHLTSSLQINFDHTSSHLLLAYTQDALRAPKAKSLLPLYYFLVLEPDGRRAEEAFNALEQVFGMNVRVQPTEDGKPQSINISINPKKKDSGQELMLALLQASQNLEENKDKTEIELFHDKTSDFIAFLDAGNFKDNTIYSERYLPFFKILSRSEHMEVFCNYISMNTIEGTRKWLDFHLREQDAFFNWMQQNRP